MPRLLWLCPLVEHRLPQHWAPAIYALQDGPAGRFPCVWTTTDANRERPWACGVAEMTEAQEAVVRTDSRILVFREATERRVMLQELSASRRAALQAFLIAIGLPPAPLDDTVDTVLGRLITANEFHKSVTSVLRELAIELERLHADRLRA